MTKTCFIVDATRAGHFELFQYQAISRAAEGLVDVFLLTNDSGAETVGNCANVSMDEILARSEFKITQTSLIPGNPDLKLLAFLSRPEMEVYESFIRMEYDCVFAESISNTIRELTRIAHTADLGVSGVFRKDQHPRWVWWKTLKNDKSGETPAAEKMFGAFLPLMVFNRRFLETYRDYLRAGWTGHYEALFPSVANWADLRTVDFCAGDAFRIDKKVFTIHRPSRFDTDSGFMFHPVKSFGEFCSLPTRTLHYYNEYQSKKAFDEVKFYADEDLTADEFDYLKTNILRADNLVCLGRPGVAEAASYMGLQHVAFSTTRREEAVSFAKHPALRDIRSIGGLSVRYNNVGRTDLGGKPIEPIDRHKWPRQTNLNWIPDDADLIILSGALRTATAAALYLQMQELPNTRVIIDCDPNHVDRDMLDDLFVSLGACGRMIEMGAREGKSVSANKVISHFLDEAT